MALVGQRRAVGAALSSRQLRDSSTSKQKPEGEERTPADVQINGRRSTSRRWVDRNKKPSMWARPPSVGEVKVVPAYEHVLLEDCEDATDFVDSDETPDAVARRERALAVLHKPRGARSAEEVDFLCSLLAGVHFFEKRNPEERHEIARGLALRRVEAHEKVFTIGSSASTFYVILQGAARAYIPIEATDFAVPTEDESASSGVFNSHVLEDGDSFGEKGLLLDAYGKMQPRNVEVIAAVPSLLLCLSRADYEESLQTLRDRRALKHARMLRNVFVFRDWSDEDLQRLGAVVTERRFEKGVAILKQGSRLGDSMFFLIKGECRELQLMEVSDAQRQMLEVTSSLQGSPLSSPYSGARLPPVSPRSQPQSQSQSQPQPQPQTARTRSPPSLARSQSQRQPTPSAPLFARTQSTPSSRVQSSAQPPSPRVQSPSQSHSPRACSAAGAPPRWPPRSVVSSSARTTREWAVAGASAHQPGGGGAAGGSLLLEVRTRVLFECSILIYPG